MRPAGDVVLEFVMRQWSAMVRALMPQRPTDLAQVRVEGYDTDRVLILGDGPAVGYGVSSQNLALLGTLARELSALSGRGTTADLVADPMMTAEKAVALVPELLVWRYDYVFIVLGITDTMKLTSVAAWRRHLARLLAAMSEELAVSAYIVVAGVPPIASIRLLTWPFSTIASRRADAINAATVELCAGLPRVKYVEVPQTKVSAVANGYGILASVLAGSLSRELNDDEHLEGLHRETTAVLSRPGVAIGADLARIGVLARQAFQLGSLAVRVVHGDSQWSIDPEETGLAPAAADPVLSAFTRHSGDVTIVGDTRLDKRFRSEPAFVGDSRIRFYASFPIESPRGVPVASLCVTDTEPKRRLSDVDVVSLRQLAQLAMRELWQYVPEQHEPRS